MLVGRFYIVCCYLCLWCGGLPQAVFAQDKWTIRGTVLDQDERPISNATITIWPDQTLLTSDEYGKFIYIDLYEGTYRIEVSHVGYEAKSLSVNLEGKDQDVILTLVNSGQNLEGIDITAKKMAVDNLVQAEHAAMPVTVISGREIELMGSRRLDEIMKEQTGIAIVNDISGGARSVGVQLQGFSSNYVMVLLDGQPMVGRNNGNFDLSRISVTNIERIEIIKGASSCLYGSDALGGAINIITKHGASVPQFHGSLLYGTLNTLDGTLEAETPFNNQRGNLVVSTNYYRTDGFNTDRTHLSGGTTVPPYQNFSLQGRSRYRTSVAGTVGLTARYTKRVSDMIQMWDPEWINQDSQTDMDFNLSGNYDHRFESGLRTMTRYYYTRYATELQTKWLKQDALLQAENFGQNIHRLEQQFTYSPFRELQFIGGIGGHLEDMDHDQLDRAKTLATGFAFLQSEWRISEKWNSTAGLRFDISNVYKGHINPSFGLQYNASESLIIKGGMGAGFKTPDYKMRYQVFYNPSANYMVIGSDRVQEVTQTMHEKGELSDRNSYMIGLAAGKLKAEKSLSTNLGMVWNPTSRLRAEVSGFYHKINNQIHAVAVGNGTIVGQVFTYRNLPQAINTGFETSTSYSPFTDFEIAAGYQFLIAKDLAVIDSIRAGKYPYNQMINNPHTGESKPVTEESYWGLEDRSKHMFNVRLLYEYRPWDMTLNLRANIRGRYPFQEINGNQFIDEFDAFVPDHTLLNLTIEKRILSNRLTVRLVADNLMNFTHRYMPGQTGRVILAGIQYRWFRD